MGARVREPDQLRTPAEIDAFVPPAMGEPGLYVWAWDDESAGRARARFFPTHLGIAEDEATGAAAVLMGERLGRPLTIRQGVGSELLVRPDRRRPDRGRRPGGARRAAGLRAQSSVIDDAGRRDWDAIVIGLGGIGSGAAYWLSRGSATVSSVWSSSSWGMRTGPRRTTAGSSAIVPPARLRPACAARLRTWAEVEAESGERVVTVTGGLDLWPADAAIHAIDDYTGSLTAEGIPFDLLDADEIRRRWPQWQIDDATTGLFQAEGGLADPIRGNRPHRDLATRRGRDAPRTDARDRDPRRGRRRVRGCHRGRRDVPDGRESSSPPTPGPTSSSRTSTAASRSSHQGAGDLLRLPGPGARSPPTGSRSGSGWTTRASTASRRTARRVQRPPRTVGGTPMRPATPDVRARRGGLRPRATAFMARHLPGALGPPIYTRTCLYTLTPDRDFVVDRLPDAPGVVVVLGAAHGFKFASVLGRIVSELLVDGGDAVRAPRSAPSPSTDPSWRRRADAPGGPTPAALSCVCKAPRHFRPMRLSVWGPSRGSFTRRQSGGDTHDAVAPACPCAASTRRALLLAALVIPRIRPGARRRRRTRSSCARGRTRTCRS